MRSIGMVLATIGGILIFLAIKGKAGRAITALIHPDTIAALKPPTPTTPTPEPSPTPLPLTPHMSPSDIQTWLDKEFGGKVKA